MNLAEGSKPSPVPTAVIYIYEMYNYKKKDFKIHFYKAIITRQSKDLFQMSTISLQQT